MKYTKKQVLIMQIGLEWERLMAKECPAAHDWALMECFANGLRIHRGVKRWWEPV